MKAIYQIIGKTADEYQDMVFNYYFQWCVKHAYDCKDLQQLLADTALFNWFMAQYRKLEGQFLQNYGSENIKSKDAELLYIRDINEIHTHYCWPLMVRARAKEILNNEDIR